MERRAVDGHCLMRLLWTEEERRERKQAVSVEPTMSRSLWRRADKRDAARTHREGQGVSLSAIWRCLTVRNSIGVKLLGVWCPEERGMNFRVAERQRHQRMRLGELSSMLEACALDCDLRASAEMSRRRAARRPSRHLWAVGPGAV